MSKHGETERSIIRVFEKEESFIFENKEYKIINIGKPSPSKGECKTDIYILAKNISTSIDREFKISVKQGDADFLENKMSLDRAMDIFGDDAKDVMTKSIKSVEESFYNDYLVYFNRFKRTEEKCIKIGWKFELINKYGGERSGLMLLTDKQKIDVYSGTNLNDDKRNAKVNGIEICDSGVADYILEVDNSGKELNFYVENLKPIKEFAVSQDIYFACKAINYRSIPDKWDGNRPLAVFVEWRLKKNILFADLVIDRPLEIKANAIGENIRSILKQLNINSNNFSDLKNYLDKDVKYI